MSMLETGDLVVFFLSNPAHETTSVLNRFVIAFYG
tara:strand:+ start:69200 stop:69304 length:105 start_codon:yes stop_codon:yes gene_type:complete